MKAPLKEEDVGDVLCQTLQSFVRVVNNLPEVTQPGSGGGQASEMVHATPKPRLFSSPPLDLSRIGRAFPGSHTPEGTALVSRRSKEIIITYRGGTEVLWRESPALLSPESAI